MGVIVCATVSARGQDAAEENPTTPAAVDDTAPPTSKVTSPLVIEPTTPEELFEATLLMVELARPEVAKLYLAKFMEGDPQDELLLALREKHGPSVFLKLSNIEELQPLSLELLKRNNAAFSRFAQDPARLEAILKDLVTGTPAQRIAAQFQIETAGVLVVPALISALGNPAFAESQSVLVEIMAAIKTDAVPPLEAATTSPDSKTRQAAMQALGIIRSTHAIPHLLRFAGQAEPSEDKIAASKAISQILGSRSITTAQSTGVANRLLQHSKDHFLGKIEYLVGPDNLVGIWEWDPQRGTVHERRLSKAQKSLHEGLFFAKAAVDVAPARQDVQTTYVSLLLAQEVAVNGVGQPLKTGPGTVHDLAASLGPDTVSRALGESLANRQTNAALAALQILARIGTVQQVRSVGANSRRCSEPLTIPAVAYSLRPSRQFWPSIRPRVIPVQIESWESWGGHSPRRKPHSRGDWSLIRTSSAARH